MKKFITCLTIVITAFGASADVIVTNDGNTMQVHNVEVATKWVFYTETDNADAPIKKIPIDQVFAYKIGNGALTNVGSTATPAKTEAPAANDNAQAGPQKADPVPAANNAALIASYNNHPELKYNNKDPQPDKKTEYFLSLWGIEDNSILSDENVEIGFEKVYLENDKDRSVVGHRIKVINKTDKPIYVDLGSSYKIMNGGYAVPYYKGAVYTEGSSSMQGGSLNVGAVAGALGIGGALGTLASGINVGGGNTQSAGISTAEQQVLTIPPHSLLCLPGEKFSTGKEIVECYEPIYFRNKIIPDSWVKSYTKNGDATSMTVCIDQSEQKVQDAPEATRESLNICRWLQTDFTPENTPKKIGRIITYSTSPDFSTYYSLPVNLYMRGAFGLNFNSFGSVYFYFNDKTYDCITDKEHFIVGGGYVHKQ